MWGVWMTPLGVITLYNWTDEDGLGEDIAEQGVCVNK